jgi:hypothetical protein
MRFVVQQPHSGRRISGRPSTGRPSRTRCEVAWLAASAGGAVSDAATMIIGKAGPGPDQALSPRRHERGMNEHQARLR